jgi:hypothetical protein
LGALGDRLSCLRVQLVLLPHKRSVEQKQITNPQSPLKDQRTQLGPTLRPPLTSLEYHSPHINHI